MQGKVIPCSLHKEASDVFQNASNIAYSFSDAPGKDTS